MNHVALVGRLGNDPELQYTNSGHAVATLRLAVRNDFANKDGTRGTTWLTVKAWRQTAEYIAQYGKKGSTVALTGRIALNEWTGDDGKTRRDTYIEADQLQHLGRLTARDDDPADARDDLPPRPQGRGPGRTAPIHVDQETEEREFHDPFGHP